MGRGNRPGKLLRADFREDSKEFPYRDSCQETEIGTDKWEEELGGEVEKVQLTWGEDSDNNDEDDNSLNNSFNGTTFL